MKHTILTLMLFGLGLAVLSAQPINKSSYETMVATASELLAAKDYYNALEWYEKAYEERDDRSLVPIIAELSYQLRDYTKAERRYRQALRRDDEEKKLVIERFHYGRTLKMNEKYDEAIPVLQEFLTLTNDQRLRELAQNEITGAELAMSLAGGAQGVKVEILGKEINTAQSEYTPSISPDGQTLYFATFSSKEVIVMEDENNPDNFARIFSSNKGEEGFGEPSPLGVEINRPGTHNANVSLAPDGRRLYFNRIELEGNTPGVSKVYMSTAADQGWSSANEVAGVNGEYNALHPAVGELFGSEVLFFVSDMEGGYGGLDVYYAPYKGDGVYGDPVNLGPKINSVGDEFTPWWHDGTLYYSSDGLPTMGGFDIFYTVWNGSTWSEPLNMGRAYNSSVDDISFRMDKEGYNGFLVANRPEGRSLVSKTCCNDIYGFNIAKLYADLVVGLFTADKRQPLKGGTIQLISTTNNMETPVNSLTRDNGNRFDFGLDLETPYKIVATHPDYFPDTATFNTVGLQKSKTFEQRFFLRAKPREPEYDTIAIEEPILLENILYDFDSDRIRTEAESDLQVVKELMDEYPTMRIELGSHTDARGNDEYNRDLSQRRADSARRWLVRNGIVRERIEAKGYGESVPKVVDERIAGNLPYLKIGDVLTEDYINKLPNEEQKEAAHEQNRRTEFKIIEGPTSIVIKRTRLRKQENTNGAPDRQRNIGAEAVEQPTPKAVTPPAKPQASPTAKPAATPVKPKVTPADTLKISNLSSLYMQKDLKGLPVMQFKKRFYDLGKVKKGDSRTFTYEFVNRGTTDLLISIISACDCTTTDYSKRAYKPGESGVIKVTFDSTEKDESETIDVDVYLKNKDNKGNTIRETVQYKFTLIK